MGTTAGPSDWLRRRLDKLEPEIEAAGIRLGRVLGCGNEACVFEKSTDPRRVYKAGASYDEGVLGSRLIAHGSPHPCIVKHFAVHIIPDPIWGTHKHFAFVLIEREHLTFDLKRSESILSLMSNIEMVCNAVSPAHVVRAAATVSSPRRLVMHTLDVIRKSEGGWDVLLPPNEDVEPAILFLEGLAWAYMNVDALLGDLWALGFGRGYGTKPENVGWRGNTPVVADLGIWRDYAGVQR